MAPLVRAAMMQHVLKVLVLSGLCVQSANSAKQKVKDPAAAFERRYAAAMAAAREGDLETAYTKFKAAAKLKTEVQVSET